jgi:hypothetical protein
VSGAFACCCGAPRPDTLGDMTSMQELPTVGSCAVSSCSYNQDSDCHAGAITVGGGDKAACGTFVEISFRGGLDRGGLVGACHRSECRFNDKLECTASSVQIGPGADVADCLTYEAR